MRPEQVTEAALLTGSKPFPGRSTVDTATRHAPGQQARSKPKRACVTKPPQTPEGPGTYISSIGLLLRCVLKHTCGLVSDVLLDLPAAPAK